MIAELIIAYNFPVVRFTIYAKSNCMNAQIPKTTHPNYFYYNNYKLICYIYLDTINLNIHIQATCHINIHVACVHKFLFWLKSLYYPLFN